MTQELIQTIIDNDFDRFEELLNQKPDQAKHADADGNTLAHFAATHNRASMLVVLAHEGSDLNKQNIFNETPLDLASVSGNLQAVDALIDLGAKTRDIPNSNPLSSAAHYGHDKIVERLVAANADPNEKMIDGNRPLHWIASSEHVPLQKAVNIINELVAAGADLQAQNNDGQTPADVAADNQRKMILTTGFGGADFKEWQAANRQQIERKNRRRFTP